MNSENVMVVFGQKIINRYCYTIFVDMLLLSFVRVLIFYSNRFRKIFLIYLFFIKIVTIFDFSTIKFD